MQKLHEFSYFMVQNSITIDYRIRFKFDIEMHLFSFFSLTPEWFHLGIDAMIISNLGG